MFPARRAGESGVLVTLGVEDSGLDETLTDPSHVQRPRAEHAQFRIVTVAFVKVAWHPLGYEGNIVCHLDRSKFARRRLGQFPEEVGPRRCVGEVECFGIRLDIRDRVAEAVV